MAKKGKTFLESIASLLEEEVDCSKCSYRDLAVCPIRGLELCKEIRGL